MEYDADKPLLRVVGFEYFPNPQVRLSLMLAASLSESDQQRNYRRIELHTRVPTGLGMGSSMAAF
ncbi:uncharacterized protein PpBr36_11109 [Pyricularia pennisetigena]|uniref:uncharacterized protein n=1 Tax=Pyricularia pennisetigena TaxID=1578925 RepID=UPI001154E2E7|nr:uncharacterized protein PpBr36_11109 [Pyricularia pennisetigena]TLS20661.1 hypothetical protein PpBr36_11109 [Pyricularia pennisetigena]